MVRKSPEAHIAEDSGVPMDAREVVSFDGTPIEYRIRRAGPRWLVVANGYAGTFLEWRALLPRLVPRLSLLLWDYRGMYRSGVPADPTRLTIQDDSRDLEAILAAEGIERIVLCGWSVGVQVALEHYRRRPDQIEALILHNGLAQRVLDEAADSPWLPRLLRPFARAMSRFGRAAHHLARPLTRVPAVPSLFRLAGIIERHEDHFRDAVRSIGDLDLAVYFRMVLYANEHSTEDIWPTVRVPTLVTYGRNDLFSPRSHAERLARSLPMATVRELPGGHYGLMEHPDVVSAVFQEFLDSLPPLEG